MFLTLSRACVFFPLPNTLHPMVHLTNELFLATLRNLYEAQAAKGSSSIFLTQKRVLPRTPGGAPSCLYRVTDGKSKTYATSVTEAGASKFHALLMPLMKTSMGALQKVEKKKAKAMK